MPLLWLSLAFIAGIIIADNAVLLTATWLILAGVALGLSSLVFITQRIKKRRSFGLEAPSPWSSLAPVLLLVATLGGIRYQTSLPDLNDPNFIASHNDTGERVSIMGVIDSFPDLRDHSLYLRIQTEDIRPYGTTTQHEPLYGLLLVRLDPVEGYQYGDRLLLHGFLETPSEAQEFSYREYLARQGVYSYMGGGRATRIESGQGNPFWAAIYSLKENALQTVYHLWPDPEASLLKDAT